MALNLPISRVQQSTRFLIIRDCLWEHRTDRLDWLKGLVRKEGIKAAPEERLDSRFVSIGLGFRHH